MTESVKTAGEFLRSLGCTGVMGRDIDGVFGQVRGERNGAPILVRVQLKKEWGTPAVASNGLPWDAPRFPYASVQLVLQPAAEGPDTHTHYLIVSGDYRRVFLCPKEVSDEANRAWMAVESNGVSENVQTAVVANWTKGCSFCVKNPSTGKWGRDPQNVWAKPKPVCMDPDEFLASL